MHFITATTVLGFIAVQARAYPNPGACSGACGTHDPGLIRRESDGVYFRFSTGNNVSYASASSIEGPWTVVGSMLPKGSKINLAGNKDLWAPEAHLIGSTYYVYYSVSTFGSQNSEIGLATSATMDYNSWTDLGSVGVQSNSTKPYNAIDSNLIERNGIYYMNYGSFWHDIYQAEMNSDATVRTGDAQNIAYNSTGTHAEEGSFMYQYGSYYYLFYSEGICCGYATSKPAPGAEYKVKVCRSTSVNSGFVDQSGVSCLAGGGTIVLRSHGSVYGPGGQGVFDHPSLGPVLYYHYFNTSIGLVDSDAQFGWNQVDFSSGWPVLQ